MLERSLTMLLHWKKWQLKGVSAFMTLMKLWLLYLVHRCWISPDLLPLLSLVTGWCGLLSVFFIMLSNFRLMFHKVLMERLIFIRLVGFWNGHFLWKTLCAFNQMLDSIYVSLNLTICLLISLSSQGRTRAVFFIFNFESVLKTIASFMDTP